MLHAMNCDAVVLGMRGHGIVFYRNNDGVTVPSCLGEFGRSLPYRRAQSVSPESVSPDMSSAAEVRRLLNCCARALNLLTPRCASAFSFLSDPLYPVCTAACCCSAAQSGMIQDFSYCIPVLITAVLDAHRRVII